MRRGEEGEETYPLRPKTHKALSCRRNIVDTVNDIDKFKNRPGSFKAKPKTEEKPAPAADKPKPAPAAEKPKPAPAADKPKPPPAAKPSVASKVGCPLLMVPR